MYIANKLVTVTFSFLRSCAILFPLLSLVLINKVSAQAKPDCNKITSDMGFTIRSVIIKGRWVPKELQKKIEEQIGLGKLFDPARVDIAREMVRTEIKKGEEHFAIRLLGSTSVLLISSDICDVSDSTHSRQAEITIRPFYLRIDLYNIGGNILPVPRTLKPSFFSKVPAILLATSPKFGLRNDRQFGPSLNIQTSTDLLHFPGVLKTSKKLALLLAVDARRSLSAAFHSIATSLELGHPVYANKGFGWSIGLEYTNGLQPVGTNEHRLEQVRFFAGIQGNLRTQFLRKYASGGSVSLMQNRFSIIPGTISNNPENSYAFHALGDGRIGNGFSRMGIWFNAAVPKDNKSLWAYQRLAWRYGYSVSIGRSHNTIDLEANCGLGYCWGTAPAYNQFYAGNALSDFLYTPLKSVQFQSFPEGPVVRSLGEHEGGFQTSPGVISGGSSYWNLNLSIAVPIPKWSAPLIPNIVIDEDAGTTVQQAIKAQSNTAEAYIQSDLVQNRGLTNEEADIEAERIVNKDIRPVINYLADHANVYSIKPLLLFDLAQVNKRGIGDRLWGAAGAGLQLNIINAKLEIGYMHTLFPKSDGDKGNFLVRFTIQNLY